MEICPAVHNLFPTDRISAAPDCLCKQHNWHNIHRIQTQDNLRIHSTPSQPAVTYIMIMLLSVPSVPVHHAHQCIWYNNRSKLSDIQQNPWNRQYKAHNRQWLLETHCSPKREVLTVFTDKIISRTLLWQLLNSQIFPGFPDKWSPEPTYKGCKLSVNRYLIRWINY